MYVCVGTSFAHPSLPPLLLWIVGPTAVCVMVNLNREIYSVSAPSNFEAGFGSTLFDDHIHTTQFSVRQYQVHPNGRILGTAVCSWFVLILTNEPFTCQARFNVVDRTYFLSGGVSSSTRIHIHFNDSCCAWTLHLCLSVIPTFMFTAIRVIPGGPHPN